MGTDEGGPRDLVMTSPRLCTQVVARFNRLRQEQRGLASKAAELELELNEHGWGGGQRDTRG